jgi:hypothetical protein
MRKMCRKIFHDMLKNDLEKYELDKIGTSMNHCPMLISSLKSTKFCPSPCLIWHILSIIGKKTYKLSIAKFPAFSETAVYQIKESIINRLKRWADI